MRILRLPADLPDADRGAHLSIGNFDGVHLGHRALLAAVLATARAARRPAAALTFEPHPPRILRPESAAPLITPLDEKIRQLESTGLDLLLILPFSRDLSLLTPRQFVERILHRGLGAGAVHEGQNFRFGHRHAGDVAALEALGREFAFAVHVHPPVVVRGEVVSSSRIRELVAAGRVERAARLLGRCVSVRGAIARGQGLGRRLTVPTLNLQPYAELLPARGVYVTETFLSGRGFPSVTNVGYRPTFGGTHLVVETHLLAFEELESDDMEIRFRFRLRDESKFESAAELKRQIGRDVHRAQAYWRRLRTGPERT